MPELPEVETLRRALLPLVKNKTLLKLKFFRKDIRFPIPREKLKEELSGKIVSDITRRGKYLLMHVPTGAMILHLGMSGRVVRHPSMKSVENHTHAIFHFEPDVYLHFIDPRRFGCILWAQNDEGHPLLNHLGLDPLGEETTPKALKVMARNRKVPIKSFLMDSKRITGVGNIYACESLFDAAIHPMKHAGKITLAQWQKLIPSLQSTLKNSIASGGTTLRDFFSADNTPGYYAVNLSVYGKENQPCPHCQTPISRTVHSGRSTFYCKVCQKK
ncbi:MAG: formamidopyrimidine-DNA glycosylase [Nitrospinaceae bacterium]|nr:MAG: formamidopyrimidine-DNA glycosylase [Nitrospinaceae bacterium]